MGDDFSNSLEHHYEIYVEARRVPAAHLPIAADHGGNLVVLSLEGANTGSVYFWNHEIEGLEEDPASPRHLLLVNRSFLGFLNALEEEPEA